MSSSSALKWSILIIFLMSVTWKIAILPDNQNDLNDDLVEFFERNHFNVVVTRQLDLPIIQANKASCRLQIARLSPDGSNQDFIRSLAMGTDRLFVIFRGRVYTQQPIFWTALNHLWSSFLRHFGLIGHMTAIIAVAANSSCDVERLPWQELRGVS